MHDKGNQTKTFDTEIKKMKRPYNLLTSIVIIVD
jgi:N-acetylmuramoyl-L-alanine amidase CwlA